MLRLLRKMQLFLSKLRKVLDAVFGFGDEVADHALTPAESRKVGRDPEYKSLNDIKKHVKTVYTKY